MADAPSVDAPLRTGPLTCEIVEGGCDEVITAASGGWIPIMDRHEPGLTLCIAAGTYSQLYLAHVSGAPGSPITVINCGGRVIFDSTGGSIGIEGVDVQDLHLTGTGDPAIEHGFEQRSANIQGVSFDQRVTRIEVDHIEVHDNPWLGIGIRNYPRCDGAIHRGNWVQEDTLVHHNYIHDITSGEGMYLGTSHFYTPGRAYLAMCPELGYLEPELHGVSVHDNLLERIGADGIQVGGAVEGMEIAHNVVRHFALTQDPGDLGGLMINPGSVGSVHHNWVEAFDDGVFTDVMPVDGLDDRDADVAVVYSGGDTGDIDIHDNVIVDAQVGFMVLGHHLAAAHTTSFHDNTMTVRFGGMVMELYCNPDLAGAEHAMTIEGNIFAGYSAVGPHVFDDSAGRWFRIFSGASSACPIGGHVYNNALEPDLSIPGNYYAHDVADVGFVDADGGDFHLAPGSPAAGMGADLVL